MGGVNLKLGLKGSSSQSITAAPSNPKEVTSEKIVSVIISASEGISVDGFNFI